MAVYPDRVAAQRRRVRQHVLGKEGEYLPLRFFSRDPARDRRLDNAACSVELFCRLGNPLKLLRLRVDDEVGTFGDDLELSVGEDDGDLDDLVRPGVDERGHLEVHPDKEVVAGHTRYTTIRHE